MTEGFDKCPFMNGCPFKECKTKEDMTNKFKELKNNEIWKPFLEKMGGCPLWGQCPMSKTST